MPLECFKLFYTEQIFQDLVDFANENARRRKESDPDNNKGDWKILTVDELTAYYGLVIMKDIIKLDRDAHYWHQGVNTSSSTLDLEMSWVETESFKSINTSTLSTLLTNCTKFSIFWTVCIRTFRMSMCHMSMWQWMRQWCHSRVFLGSNSLWWTNPWNLGSSCGCWLMLWQPTVTTWRSTQVNMDSRSTD